MGNFCACFGFGLIGKYNCSERGEFAGSEMDVLLEKIAAVRRHAELMQQQFQNCQCEQGSQTRCPLLANKRPKRGVASSSSPPKSLPEVSSTSLQALRLAKVFRRAGDDAVAERVIGVAVHAEALDFNTSPCYLRIVVETCVGGNRRR